MYGTNEVGVLQSEQESYNYSNTDRISSRQFERKVSMKKQCHDNKSNYESIELISAEDDENLGTFESHLVTLILLTFLTFSLAKIEWDAYGK